MLIAVAFPWLSQFIAWLNGQPSGTQGLVLIVVTAVVGFIISAIVWTFGRIKAWFGRIAARHRTKTEAERQEARDRAEQRAEELGVQDHIENAQKLDDALRLAGEALGLAKELYGVLRARAGALLSVHGMSEKRQIQDDAAAKIAPLVSRLEAAVLEFRQKSQAAIKGGLLVMMLTPSSVAEFAAIAKQRQYWASVRAAAVQGSIMFGVARTDLGAAWGQTQKLNRVVVPAEKAITDCIEGLALMVAFCDEAERYAAKWSRA